MHMRSAQTRLGSSSLTAWLFTSSSLSLCIVYMCNTTTVCLIALRMLVLISKGRQMNQKCMHKVQQYCHHRHNRENDNTCHCLCLCIQYTCTSASTLGMVPWPQWSRLSYVMCFFSGLPVKLFELYFGIRLIKFGTVHSIYMYICPQLISNRHALII